MNTLTHHAGFFPAPTTSNASSTSTTASSAPDIMDLVRESRRNAAIEGVVWNTVAIAGATVIALAFARLLM